MPLFFLISIQRAASEAIEIIQIFVQYKGESLSHRSRNPIPSPQLTALWRKIVFRVFSALTDILLLIY